MAATVERYVGVQLLAAIVRGVHSATFATVFTETIPTLTKRGNPFWDRNTKTWSIRKRAHTRVVIGGTYAGAVNTRRAKATSDGHQEQFQSQGRSWGERLKLLGGAHRKGKRASILSHNGRLYLDVQALQVLSSSFVGIDGEEIPRDQVTPFMRKRKSSQTQQLEDEVKWRDYALTNVRQLRMQGQTFTVVLDSTANQQPTARAA